jgi:hypothetical protein
MPTFLPKDSNDQPIPALRLKNGGAHSVAVTASSARNASGFNAATRVVSLYATHAMYIKFGDDEVSATSSDHYFPAGIYYDVAIGGDNTAHYTNIAAIRVSENGTLYISEKE